MSLENQAFEIQEEKESDILQWSKRDFSNIFEQTQYTYLRREVEIMVEEVVFSLSPEFWKNKEDLVNYITDGKLGTYENQALENMFNNILYGKNSIQLISGGSVFPNIPGDNLAAWKLKYLYENRERPLNDVISEILEKDKERKKVQPLVSQKKEDDVPWYQKGLDYIGGLWDSLKTSLGNYTAPVRDRITKNILSSEHEEETESVMKIYESFKGKENLDFLPFYLAFQGWSKLKSQLKNKTYLTIVDFSKSNKQKRFFVLNMETRTVENAVQVAHGQNSGREYATRFSNTLNSNQSSLGFFRTPSGRTRPNNGKKWTGLRLNGIERTFNTNASSRGIFIHEVLDVAYSNGKSTSQGCFAIPKRDNPDAIMKKVQGDSLIYSYYPDNSYLRNSLYFQR